MDNLRRRGWTIKGGRIWSDFQGPFLEGLDFSVLGPDEPRKLGVNAECIGRKSGGKMVWLVKENGDWAIKVETDGAEDDDLWVEKLMERSEKTLTFVEKAWKKHGKGRWGYEKVKYIMASERVEIHCFDHGSFFQSPTSHSGGSGCHKCSSIKRGTKRTYSYEYFLAKSREVHGEKYSYVKDSYINSQIKMSIRCKIHGIFQQTPTEHFKRGCPRCGNEERGRARRMTYEIFVKKAREVHGDKYDYFDKNYITSQTKITISCKKHGDFLQSPNNHLRGHGCIFCTHVVQKTTEKFIKEATELHNGEYDYSLTEYTKAHTKVVIICKIHGKFNMTPAHHVGGGEKCPKCYGKITKTTEEFIVEAKTIHGDKYTYDITEYITAKHKVLIFCPQHGKFLQRPFCHLRGAGCPKCSYSRGEAKICRILESMNIIYEPQKRFDECVNKRRLPFDFYIPSLNLLVEFDGELHFRGTEYFGGEEKLKQTQYHDSIKTKFAEENGYTLLRIRYDENIREKLTPYLTPT